MVLCEVCLDVWTVGNAEDDSGIIRQTRAMTIKSPNMDRIVTLIVVVAVESEYKDKEIQEYEQESE